jgi:predicted NBD/HSP70 family sugar kinase
MTREAIVEIEGGSMGSRSLLRRMNSLGVLRAVMSGPRTMRELARESGLSRTAVDAVVSDLVAMGWLTASESTPPGRLGRPASVFGLTAGLGNLLAIDIGANHIYVVVTDLTGHIIGTLSRPVEESTPASERISTAVDTANDLLRELTLERDNVWAMTIGSPGAISTTGEVLYFGGSGMPGWTGLNLRELFANEFDAAVLVEGDVALGAHAELSFGAAQGHRDVVFILCGVRTSGASIVDGRVHRGVHGAAGIVGEMPELKWAELNEQYGRSILGSPRPSRQQIFHAAREKDPAALAAVDEFADDLATGAAAMTLAIDPEVLIIGGGSAPGADVFLDRFEERLGEICPLPPEVVVSPLGSEAVALGGISLAMTRLHDELDTAVRRRAAFPDPGQTAGLLRQG